MVQVICYSDVKFDKRIQFIIQQSIYLYPLIQGVLLRNDNDGANYLKMIIGFYTDARISIGCKC